MTDPPDTHLVLAETVRAALLDAARQTYEDAGIRGLCADGRWEAAVAAMQQLDLSTLIGHAAGGQKADGGRGTGDGGAGDAPQQP